MSWCSAGSVCLCQSHAGSTCRTCCKRPKSAHLFLEFLNQQSEKEMKWLGRVDKPPIKSALLSTDLFGNNQTAKIPVADPGVLCTPVESVSVIIFQVASFSGQSSKQRLFVNIEAALAEGGSGVGATMTSMIPTRQLCCPVRPETSSTQDTQREAKQMGPVGMNGGVHTARKQHQRICIRICARASSVDWA